MASGQWRSHREVRQKSLSISSSYCIVFLLVSPDSELAIGPEPAMLLSAKRTIIATCAVVTCVILIGLNRLHLIPAASKLSSEEAWGVLKPYWTTEQEEPRFAYVQYATDFDYLCNAVRRTSTSTRSPMDSTTKILQMMNFVRLDRFATHFDRALIHPNDWEVVRHGPVLTAPSARHG